MLIDKKLIDTE